MSFRSHLKSAAKSVSWRVVGALDTFGLTFLMTGKIATAAGIVGLEVLTKSVLYYGHERAWEASWITKWLATGGVNA